MGLYYVGARPGRRRRTTPLQDLRLVNAARRHPFATSRELLAASGLHVSLSTVKRRLVGAGLRGRLAAKKERLFQTHRRARLRFARVRPFVFCSISNFSSTSESRACPLLEKRGVYWRKGVRRRKERTSVCASASRYSPRRALRRTSPKERPLQRLCMGLGLGDR